MCPRMSVGSSVQILLQPIYLQLPLRFRLTAQCFLQGTTLAARVALTLSTGGRMEETTGQSHQPVP